MSITKNELLEIINDVCPWCRQDKPLRFRTDTNEFTHSWNEKSGIDSVIVNHRMCEADKIRKRHQSVLES